MKSHLEKNKKYDSHIYVSNIKEKESEVRSAEIKLVPLAESFGLGEIREGDKTTVKALPGS